MFVKFNVSDFRVEMVQMERMALLDHQDQQ